MSNSGLAPFLDRDKDPLFDSLGVRRLGMHIDIASLPFAPGDASGGTENELQAEVSGPVNQVDLPVMLRRSRYFANLAKHVAKDEAPRQIVNQLERYLADDNRVWENSWVRLPRKSLSSFANEVLEKDLRNGHTRGQRRSDYDRFLFATSWGEWLRVPVSYLLKLSLADVLGRQPAPSPALRTTALRLFEHFANDLTSPETHSFYIVNPSRETLGKSIAREMGTRFLLTHLLIEWSNKVLGLESLGQKARVHFSPHAPMRQRELNDCISDSFYCELFVSPCLSGWDDGQLKHEYMRLAYRTTSRSRINAVVKLRDAGLIPNNLVVLPNTSSVALANNGTHLSLGSKRISQALADRNGSFNEAHEKYIGDLVIKILEHFLPLFVGIYTAAPMRLAFKDLHPELALGFLPHALDYTHLRMLWRHWKRKAHLRFWRQPISPFGVSWLDTIISTSFRVSGDLVPDYRLIDFPVAWLCTESVSALDGSIDNVSRLKLDLEAMGVSDRRLKFYMPISLREFESMGFSGFEGRHYSVFESFENDFAGASNLQQLITILAFKYALSGTYQHRSLPDDPSSESERRLPFFYAALGLPAFNVRANTRNDFLRRAVSLTRATTPSRHRNYLRVSLPEYLLALLRIIETDAADIVELLRMQDSLKDLRERIVNPAHRADQTMLRNITGKSDPKAALGMRARDFNLTAEGYYRDTLKRRLLREGLQLALNKLSDADIRGGLSLLVADLDVPSSLTALETSLLQDRLSQTELNALIRILIALIAMEMEESDRDVASKDCASA